ncbi:MAG: DUF1326 domain-containing protein [Opitutales bacterium]
MVRKAYLIAVLATMASALSAERPEPSPPSGVFIDLNTCQVYTGGCTAAAEFGSHGRALLRSWHFDSGSRKGVSFDGLSVAVLMQGDRNLTADRNPADRSVIYTPAAASADQQAALAAWVRDQEGERLGTVAAVKTVSMAFRRTGFLADLSIGSAVQVATAPLEACDLGGCGQQLWYTPRTAHNGFQVIRNAGSRLEEPALGLLWQDGGTPSVFIGMFGERSLNEEFCSPLYAALD